MYKRLNKKYKTNLCKHWSFKSNCNLGDSCQFAHGQNELRKTYDPLPFNKAIQITNINPADSKNIFEMRRFTNYKDIKCKFFESGFCKNESQCRFAHNNEEILNLKNQKHQVQLELLNFPIKSSNDFQRNQNQNSNFNINDRTTNQLLFLIDKLQKYETQLQYPNQQILNNLSHCLRLIQNGNIQDAGNKLQLTIYSDLTHKQLRNQDHQQFIQQALNNSFQNFPQQNFVNQFQQNQLSQLDQQQQQLTQQMQQMQIQPQQPQQALNSKNYNQLQQQQQSSSYSNHSSNQSYQNQNNNLQQINENQQNQKQNFHNSMPQNKQNIQDDNQQLFDIMKSIDSYMQNLKPQKEQEKSKIQNPLIQQNNYQINFTLSPPKTGSQSFKDFNVESSTINHSQNFQPINNSNQLNYQPALISNALISNKVENLFQNKLPQPQLQQNSSLSYQYNSSHNKNFKQREL